VLVCGDTRVAAVSCPFARRRCLPIARRRLSVLIVHMSVIGCGLILVLLITRVLRLLVGHVLVIVLAHGYAPPMPWPACAIAPGAGLRPSRRRSASMLCPPFPSARTVPIPCLRPLF